uniref:Uncharacterized protein n=1 Tax=Glossina pallidipes TaxID=7398 RepID=A0A1A9ZIQ8_GLOPL
MLITAQYLLMQGFFFETITSGINGKILMKVSEEVGLFFNRTCFMKLFFNTFFDESASELLAVLKLMSLTTNEPSSHMARRGTKMKNVADTEDLTRFNLTQLDKCKLLN